MTPAQREADIHRLAMAGRTPWHIAVLWHLPVAKVRLILHRQRFTAPIIALDAQLFEMAEAWLTREAAAWAAEAP